MESGLRITLKLQRLPPRRSQKLQNSATIAQSAPTAHTVDNEGRIRRRNLERKLKTYLENISLRFEEERSKGCNWDAESNVRTNVGTWAKKFVLAS